MVKNAQLDRSGKSRQSARRAGAQQMKTAPSKPAKPKGTPRASRFPIVGIGASAGGLAAISELIKALPANPGMAFIVVIHLHPKGGSVLDTLLSPMTRMPVRQAHDNDVIKANHVYVIPAAKYLTVQDGRLHTAIHRIHQHKTVGAIDRLFVSLAKDAGKRARGVVLSGTGDDGSAGLRHIHENGGLTFVQDPGSAQFRQMPDSAIATGVTNFVLPPDKIALQLVQKGPAPNPASVPAEETDAGSDVLSSIIAVVAQRSGVDYSQYKSPTLQRRIARRMAQKGFASAAAYLHYLHAHPDEARELSSALLINVSGFFRDTEAFRALERRVIMPLALHADSGKPIRVWVPGCARGEEVYSIGMLLLEHLDRRGKMPRIQMFGTDVSASDIDAARIGCFSEQALANVSSRRLKRFFDKIHGDRYQVCRELRQLCVFACQEVGSDPPFSNVDLISCRNLLIYFKRPLQERVIETFHYALKSGGALFLGRSESLGDHSEQFTALDRKNRIYTRKGASNRRPSRPAPSPTRNMPPQHAEPTVAEALEAPREIERLLLERYSPPGVYVDENLLIRSFVGDIGNFLQPVSGQANLQLTRMLPTEVVLDIRTAIRAARKSRQPVKRDTRWIAADGSPRDVTLVLMRAVSGKDRAPGYLVLFEKSASPAAADTGPVKAPRRHERSEIARLNRQLSAMREQLQTMIDEQERSEQELRVANEELQSSNEELQTAKEELQSANEELTTLNEELQDRNQQLDRAASELSTLIAGVNIPIVHLDRDRRIHRFSPAAQAVFNLIDSDVGRSFNQIKPSVELPDLDASIDAALQRGTIAEREVQDTQRRWYSLRVLPFRIHSGHIEGVLIALVDIDAAKRNAAAIVETMSEPLLVLDRSFRVLAANPAFYRSFQMNPAETEGIVIFELSNHLWNIPGLHRLLKDMLPRHRRFEDIRIEFHFPEIGHKVFRLNGRRIADDNTGTENILVAFRDVTDAEEVAVRIRDAREEEEQRIAHDLHDLSSGNLASLGIELARLSEQAAAAPERVGPELRTLQKKVHELGASMHDLARRIHPSIIRELGLVKALQGECQSLEDRCAIAAKLHVRGYTDDLPSAVALCIFRVVQEALRNVARHSGAGQVEVRLNATPQAVALTVRDDGGGFDAHTARHEGGMGLVGMADRVSSVGGSIEVDSAPGKGTAVRVSIPLSQPLRKRNPAKKKN
jgi:two-component system CheB/CheR fusion protein